MWTEAGEFEVFGNRLRFPVHYRELSMIGGSFSASSLKVEQLLPSNKLKPVEFRPGKSFIALLAMEYRVVEGLAPYNEFAVMAPVTYRGAPEARPSSYYVLYMPVVTEEARRLGVEVHGYPKFLADIVFSDNGPFRQCAVRALGEDIISLQCRRMPTWRKKLSVNHITMKNSRLLVTSFEGCGEMALSTEIMDCAYRLGNHPLADDLRQLDMDPNPVMCQYAPEWELSLPKPAWQLPL